MNDENTGDTVEDGGKTSESPSAIRDRSLVVKELAAAWITSERRTAYIEEGEAGARQTIKGSSDEQDPRRGRRNGITVWLRRFGALFSRTFLYKLREPSAVATQALNSIFVPLIVGSIYFQLPLTVSGAGDRLSGISLIVLLQSFMSFDQLLLFPKERGLYLHESNGGMYSTSAYYWSRSLVELWTIVLFAIICAIISYEMMGLDDSADGRFAFIAIVAAVTVAGASFLTAIGSLCKSFEQTNALAGTLLIVLMLFDGNWINRRNIWPVYYRWPRFRVHAESNEVCAAFLGHMAQFLARASLCSRLSRSSRSSDFKRHDFVCTQRAIEEEGCVPLTGRQIFSR